MFVKEVTVENQVGLHARPATFFIQKANEFKSSIWVEKEERRGEREKPAGRFVPGDRGRVRRFASSLTARTSRPLSKA